MVNGTYHPSNYTAKARKLCPALDAFVASVQSIYDEIVRGMMERRVADIVIVLNGGGEKLPRQG